jgi:hypothetical protein
MHAKVLCGLVSNQRKKSERERIWQCGNFCRFRHQMRIAFHYSLTLAPLMHSLTHPLSFGVCVFAHTHARESQRRFFKDD